MSQEALTKSGAIVSSVGVALFVVFVTILLVFPVVKQCENEKCSFLSTAPAPLQQIVQPGYLAISLMIIAAGVFMVRFGRLQRNKKTESGV